jgi:hypothetical protein
MSIVVELLGRYSKLDITSRLRSILAMAGTIAHPLDLPGRCGVCAV